MKNLVRRYKISKILDIPLEGKDKEIIDFIKSIIDGLVLFQENDYVINFMNSDGVCIIEQDSKSDILWVRYEGFWSVLEMKYSLNYVDIQIVIKGMVELTFKMSVGTPLTVPSLIKTR